MLKRKGKNAKREFVMQMQQCGKAINQCDAMGFPRNANALRLQKWIRITSPECRLLTPQLFFLSSHV
jgi:hypothetical protein